ncbi:potassium channel family protein [Flavobacterium frigidarium]|uniref:potassium channel family protein n=1 Tax=Flavobacterium frigidarium TaxID=99286 RepID=UPI0030DB2BC5
MKEVLHKLLLGKNGRTNVPDYNPIKSRIENIKAIWNNERQDDNGIEKILRLFLASSQLFLPGLYIKYFASRKGVQYKDLAVDIFVIMKAIFPLLILVNGWQEYTFIIVLMVYLVLETVFYIPTLIFASDLFSTPRSYKRSILLLFFNYLEMVFAFAVLYSCDDYLNKPFTHWFDPIYFSTVTSSTIGFGEYYPVKPIGKFLISIQSVLVLMYVVLFLNFFSTKIEPKGYFNEKDNPKQ